MKNMRKELNNKGFSLVELLIATVILAIVVAPLLHTFVTAATTTVRSQKMGDATLASENVAETVEATTLSALLNGNNFPMATSKALYSYDGSDYTLGADPDETDRYYLGVHGLQAGSSTFNAMITLNAAAYHDAVNEDGLNDILLTDYSNMDAVYSQGKGADDPDETALADAAEKVSELHEDWWFVNDAKPERTITLDVTSADNKIFARIYFDYEYSYRYNEKILENGVVVDTVTHSGTVDADQISYNLLAQGYSPVSNNGRELPNIYVIYYPIYGNSGTYHDTIKINNNIGRPFNLFLVKARGDDLTPANEQQYHAHVEQYVPANADESTFAVIYSNINEELVEEGQNRVPAALSGVDYFVYPGRWEQVRGSFAGERGDLVSKSARDRIFEVTIQIFDADDDFTTPIHTFKSTKLQ